MSAEGRSPSSLLGAILINPATGSGATTAGHLELLRDVLGCEEVQIANLLSVPTKSVLEITEAGSSFDGWHAARPALQALIATADQLLLGWGLGGGFGGAAREHFTTQIEWVERVISLRADRPLVWTVGDEPRHPSRWHQFVADKHRRTRGGDLRSRLRDVLVESSSQSGRVV